MTFLISLRKVFLTNDSFPLLHLPCDKDPRFHPRKECFTLETIEILEEIINAIKPDVRVLFMSGYSANEITDRGVLEPNMAETHAYVKTVTKLLAGRKYWGRGF
jgi:hypothetical protein